MEAPLTLRPSFSSSKIDRYGVAPRCFFQNIQAMLAAKAAVPTSSILNKVSAISIIARTGTLQEPQISAKCRTKPGKTGSPSTEVASTSSTGSTPGLYTWTFRSNGSISQPS